MTREELVEIAVSAMHGAYAPYSHFQVGAALLAANGTVYRGCNIENAAYGPTNCAERTAFFTAVCAGEREFTDIAVVGGLNGEISGFAAPCGVCRQVMREFCEDGFRIHLWDGNELRTCTLAELLPLGFRGEDMK